MGKCGKSKKSKGKTKGKKPRFECAKCGAKRRKKDHVCKPVKL